MKPDMRRLDLDIGTGLYLIACGRRSMREDSTSGICATTWSRGTVA